MAWSPERQSDTPVSGAGWWTSRPAYEPVIGAGWFNRPGAQPGGATATVTVTVTASATLTAALLIDCQQTVVASITASAPFAPGTGFPYTFPISFGAAPKLVIPEPADLTVRQFRPGVPDRVEPSAAALTIDTSTPIVVALQTTTPTPQSLTATGSAATVITPIPPTPRTLTVTGSAPIVSTGGQFPYLFPIKF